MKHTCCACNTPVHATCGEVNNAVPIEWSTTYYPCFIKRGRTFLNADDFNASLQSNPVASLPPAGALQSNPAASSPPEGALPLADKKRKRKDHIQKWRTLEWCDILKPSLTPVKLKNKSIVAKCVSSLLGALELTSCMQWPQVLLFC